MKPTLYFNAPCLLIFLRVPPGPKSNIKTLMKNIHQNAIKYLTYLVLNKRKLDIKQTIATP